MPTTAPCVSKCRWRREELACDQVLVAVGRRPRTQGFGLESLLLDMNGRAVKIDDQCRTSMRKCVGHR